MRRPPFDRKQCIVAVLVVAAVGVGSIAVVQATPSQTVSATTGDSCEYDTYSPPELDFSWTKSYKDGLSNGSERDWSGGRIVQVGGNGACSLFVGDGRSEFLDETTINGTKGVVTGTVDLGADGSVRFTAVGSNPRETTNGTVESNGTTELAISNPGPDYGTNVTLEAGEQSEERSLSNGRFFQFALRQDSGTARIAVWDLDSSWDEEWDLTVDSVTADEDWTLVLDGRAFLDGIAIGVAEPDESETTTESPTPGETTSEGEWPFPEDEQRFDDPDTDPGAESDGSKGVFFGLILAGWGVIEFRYARPLARFEEQLDAIGSTTPVSEVEPAEWKVALTKLVGVVFALVGLYLIGQGIVMQN